ncbi:MAG: CRISPR-associated helicase Cas3' [Pseudonocardiaceae bacterium]
MSPRQLWAKSPQPGRAEGEPLTTHLAAALQAMNGLRNRVGQVAALPARFWTWARLAVLLHDAGKAADGFQVMVGNAEQPAEPWGERHEVYSLGFVARVLADAHRDDRLWVATGVATHHRPFTGDADGRIPLFSSYDLDPAEFAARFSPTDTHLARELQGWLTATAQAHRLLPDVSGPAPAGNDRGQDACQLFEELRDRWELPLRAPNRPDGLTAVLLQGAVTLADHVSSAHSSLCTDQPLTADYPARLRTRLREVNAELRPHQTRAAAVDGHLLLRAPTGSGKTEAALLWAQTQIHALHRCTGGTPRVFYTLPYLASINAMTDRLCTELGTDDVGVAHSRAASYHLARALQDDCAPQVERTDRGTVAHKAVSRTAATRLFRELIRVGTPYQLLRGALAGPAHSSILIDAANSVFVLDELHAYDSHRLGMILAMLRLWEDLGGRIAVLSATLPDGLAELLDTTLAAPCERVAPSEAWPQRHRVTGRSAHLTEPSAVTEIAERLRAGQAVLVVANNVADARALYDQLVPLAAEWYGPEAALLLHSRFRRKDRSTIEQAVQARFGTRAPRRPGVLVATQVVEVSLDVDFDVLHTSGAPLDALLQRFGRVNRLGARPPAPVVVHPPDYRRRRGGGPAEYADGVYDAEPTRLATALLARHDGHVVDEREVLGWLNEIYTSDWGARWRGAVEQSRDEFRAAFLDFAHPFDDRSRLAQRFDELFDGEEAVLADDRDEYAAALLSAHGRAGRLLAEELLIPVPHHAVARCRWDSHLKVRVLDADYDTGYGLGAIRDHAGARYEPGEVL